MTAPATPRLAQNVRDLLSARVGVPVSARTNGPVTVNVGVTAAPLVKQDGARVALLFINLGSFVVFLAPDGLGVNLGQLVGIRLEPLGGNAFVWWEEDGELPAYAWQAIASGGNSGVLVFEILIDQGRVRGA